MGGGTNVAVDEDTQVTNGDDWFRGSTGDQDGRNIVGASLHNNFLHEKVQKNVCYSKIFLT